MRAHSTLTLRAARIYPKEKNAPQRNAAINTAPGSPLPPLSVKKGVRTEMVPETPYVILGFLLSGVNLKTISRSIRNTNDAANKPVTSPAQAALPLFLPINQHPLAQTL